VTGSVEGNLKLMDVWNWRRKPQDLEQRTAAVQEAKGLRHIVVPVVVVVVVVVVIVVVVVVIIIFIYCTWVVTRWQWW